MHILEFEFKRDLAGPEQFLAKFLTVLFFQIIHINILVDLADDVIAKILNPNFHFHYRWGNWFKTKKDGSHKFKPLYQKDKDSQTFSSTTPRPTTTSRPISTTARSETSISGGLADGCPKNGGNPPTIQNPHLLRNGTLQSS